MNWSPPRCIHGHIILGCPHDDCPTQLAYLDQQEAAYREWVERTYGGFARGSTASTDGPTAAAWQRSFHQ